jgi:hypothetical protein
MRTLPALLILTTACGSPTTPPTPPTKDASYDDIDNFKPFDAGSGGGAQGAGGGMMGMGGSGGGGMTQMPDAGPPMFSDAGIYATPSTPGMVFCGPSSCDLTHDTCCIEESSGPSCMPAGTCTGHGMFACDGPEDCTSSHCCLAPGMLDGGAMQLQLACNTDCSMAIAAICHTANDCPMGAACCSGPDFPLGHCIPPDTAPNGETCDVR